MVRASALQSVDLGFIPLVESYQKTLKNGIRSFPAWRSAFRGEVVVNKLASLLVVTLGKALNGTPHLYVKDRWPINLEKVLCDCHSFQQLEFSQHVLVQKNFFSTILVGTLAKTIIM